MEREGGGRRERLRESGSRRGREMDRYGDRWRVGAGGEREQGGKIYIPLSPDEVFRVILIL